MMENPHDHAFERPHDFAVELVDATKTFGTGDGAVRALRGVTLTVPQQQKTVLLGLSGSGKSTTLRLINRLHDATTGKVRVLGQDVMRLSPRELRAFRRQTAFVFQHFNLVGRLSALENVLSGGLGSLRAPRSGIMMYPNRMRVAALDQLDRVGLADQAFQRSGTLSGGQQQRVGIARALFQQPKLVLADEPVASLDPESSRQVMEILQQVCDEDGLTVICSLHQIELAIDWADRVIGLRDGQVVLDRSSQGMVPSDASGIYSADVSTDPMSES